MADPEGSPAHTLVKRARAPDTATASRSSTKKRRRIAGSKNLKNHEWVLVHQHFLQRNRENKGTVFVIHGVEHHWQNVRRKIIRACHDLKEPLKDSESLSPLPRYIELRSPSPELVPLPPVASTETGSILEALAARPEDELCLQRSAAKADTTSNEMISGDKQYDVDTAGNSFLGNLRVSEIIEVFRNPYLRQSTGSFKTISIGSFGSVGVLREDTLQVLVNRLDECRIFTHDHMNNLQMVRKLIRGHHVSTRHFLETVIRNLGERTNEVLDWLASKLSFTEFGGTALGAAVSRNNFEAVDWLLHKGVDINCAISSPHPTPSCCCQISVIAYAQLRCFNTEEAGVSEEMIAYLLDRGFKKSVGINLGLEGILNCVLRQDLRALGGSLLSRVQSIVERVPDFANIECENESFLETCILKSEFGWLDEGRIRVFDYLLAQGAQTSSGSPLAALVYRYGPRELIEKLLAKTKDINAYCNSVNLSNRSLTFVTRPRPHHAIQSVSPLQAAALCGREQIIRLLLQNGADVNCPARSYCGVTPLQAICGLKAGFRQDREMKLRIINLLLDYGADVNGAPAWNLGLNALQSAAMVGDVQVADLLCSRGADVNAPGCKYGGGPALVIAARKCDVNMVRFLLEADAAIPPGGVDFSFLRITHEGLKLISELPRIASDLSSMDGGRSPQPSRDYHEYEAIWADDPTYETSS
ncbi:hypothetical protein F5883DRAFT_540539 [Diaporthe sp. PMI_573]|nr:hypothetical protein F5883DRAFT_540539 [Diaporthaceae sp. PMI_573]